MKNIIVIFLFSILLVSCGESPCAKKAREKREAEAAAKKATVVSTPVPVVIESTEPESVNANKGSAQDASSYKVSDRICVLKKWSGTIVKIRWAKNTEDLLVYDVQYYDGNELVDGDFFDTEFVRGECSTSF